MPTPKFRLFAGPNASGKTYVFKKIRKSSLIPKEIYVNADKIEAGAGEKCALRRFESPKGRIRDRNRTFNSKTRYQSWFRDFGAQNRNRNVSIFNKEYFLCAICAPSKTIDFPDNFPGTRPLCRQQDIACR
jgi:hypothetical protein